MSWIRTVITYLISLTLNSFVLFSEFYGYETLENIWFGVYIILLIFTMFAGIYLFIVNWVADFSNKEVVMDIKNVNKISKRKIIISSIYSVIWLLVYASIGNWSVFGLYLSIVVVAWLVTLVTNRFYKKVEYYQWLYNLSDEKRRYE